VSLRFLLSWFVPLPPHPPLVCCFFFFPRQPRPELSNSRRNHPPTGLFFLGSFSPLWATRSVSPFRTPWSSCSDGRNNHLRVPAFFPGLRPPTRVGPKKLTSSVIQFSRRNGPRMFPVPSRGGAIGGVVQGLSVVLFSYRLHRRAGPSPLPTPFSPLVQSQSPACATRLCGHRFCSLVRLYSGMSSSVVDSPAGGLPPETPVRFPCTPPFFHPIVSVVCS